MLFRSPYVDLVTGSRRLCSLERAADRLGVAGSVFGLLVALYLTWQQSFAVLTPVLMATYVLLWALPLLPLLWGVDKT